MTNRPFDKIAAGLRDAAAIQRGELDPATYRVLAPKAGGGTATGSRPAMAHDPFAMIDFPIDHPGMPAMLELLEAEEVIQVKRPGVYPFLACYWNVQKAIANQGGEMVLGWMLQERPGLYVEAMHHGVWRTPSGEMKDVTDTSPKYQRATPTTFVPDARIKIEDFNRPIHITSRFLPLATDPGIEAYLAAYRDNNRAQLDLAELVFAKPVAGWEPGKPLAVPSSDLDQQKLAGIQARLNSSNDRIKTTLADLRRRQSTIVAKQGAGS